MNTAYLPVGFHRNIPNEVYQNDQSVSTSGVKRLLSCPKDYWALSPLNKGYKQPKRTSALALGSAFHTLLLEPDQFEQRIKVKEGVQSSRVPGFVGEGELEGIRAAVAEIHAMPNVSQLFTDGEAEITMVWKDKETGVMCRCRHDYFRQAHGMTVDYKTISDISEREIDRSIVKYGYYIQAAFYLDGMKALKLGDHQDFVFVFQQRDFPHKVYATTICDDTIEIGRKAYRLALKTYAAMMERYGPDRPWPAYPDKVHVRDYADIQMHAPQIDYGFLPQY